MSAGEASGGEARKALQGVGFAEDTNIRFRRTMEDSHVILDGFRDRPEEAFLGVFDGHGGADAANMTADELPKCLEKELAKSDITPTQALHNAFLEMDKKLAEEDMKYMGCTAVVCFLELREDGVRFLHTANAGDARAVLCRNGKPERLSYDHKANDPAEVERIRKAEGFVANGRVNGFLAVARSLGDHALKTWVPGEPFTSTVQVDTPAEKNILILACDGLWDVISDEEACELVQGMSNAQEIADKLLKASLDAGTMDNVSVCVAIL